MFIHLYRALFNYSNITLVMTLTLKETKANARSGELAELLERGNGQECEQLRCQLEEKERE